MLRELEKNNLKTQELARRLDLTATEAVRQLQRLSEASLIQRRPEGSYALTEYGKLVLQLSPTLEFVFKNRDYFLTHDVRCLPRQFLDRIGVLADAEFTMDAMGGINRVERIAADAKEYLWGVGTERPMNIWPTILKKIPEGVTFRCLFREKLLPPPAFERNPGVEWRVLDDIPVNVALNEREAGISFCLVGGKADYASFFGKNPAFHSWAKDLFAHYWETGRRILTAKG